MTTMTIYDSNGCLITQADNILQYMQLEKVLKYQIDTMFDSTGN
jgi:hypothetical protein